MESNYAKLVSTLRECFMLDQPDLDFGIYRIMNVRRDEIVAFLEKDLIPQVKSILKSAGSGDRGELERKLSAALEHAKELGVQDPESLEGVKELRKKLSGAADVTALENEVFSHLSNFFRRYYDAGDFVSTRRYKDGVYAIPYQGEEVKLHWANHDQYYTKTSEYFKNYRFRLSDGKTVSFVLVDASVEKDNNKAANGKERKFRIYVPSAKPAEGKPSFSCEVSGDELKVYFTYELADKGTKQDSLVAEAFDAVRGSVPEGFSEALSPSPTEKDRTRTLLQKHMNDYVKRNTFDYFIHKDLKGFLTRELDFYLKNEVLRIDEIDARSPDSFLSVLSVVKAAKLVGGKIVEFLSQLEDFQKDLWLKKKFVVESGYCLTLDRVGKEFYPDIAANAQQSAEWVALFAIDELPGFSAPLSVEFLEANPYLLLDTKHFPEDWKWRLISSIDRLDETLTGVLVNGENFQALNLLSERYRGKVKCTYVDPPYNAKSSEIVYKNTFKHSSWLSFMADRIELGKAFQSEDGVLVVAIDENEQERLGMMLDEYYSPDFYDKTCVSVIHNPGGIQGTNFSYSHEYAFFVFPSGGEYIHRVKREESNIESLRDWGAEDSKRGSAKNCFYPIIVSRENEIVGFGDVCPNDFHPGIQNVENPDGTISVYPIDDHGVERKWRYARQSIEEIQDQLICREKGGIRSIQNEKSFFRLKTVWDDKKYNANAYGSKQLNNMLGGAVFSFPKSVHTVQDSLFSTTKKDSFVLDFFAGSGTTGHAVMNLNKADGGNRKFILVEMGEYFETATKPRMLKASYSEDWSNGKPVGRKGSSNAFKYLKLESYEDTLNNLALERSEKKQSILFSTENSDFRKDYTIGYAFRSEAAGSIFSIDRFLRPFDCELKVTAGNETSFRKADMVETFNLLIGVSVDKVFHDGSVRIVVGKDPRGESVLIVWRNLDEISNESLNSIISERFDLDGDFDSVYVNGDHLVDNLKTGKSSWKTRLIEEEFKRMMFRRGPVTK